MRITVEILPWLSIAMRKKKIKFTHELAGSTFRDLLDELAHYDSAFGDVVYDRKTGALRINALAAINGQLLGSLLDYETKLNDEDKVTFIAAEMGG